MTLTSASSRWCRSRLAGVSQEDIDLVARVFTGMRNAGLDALFDVLDPDIVWVTAEDEPEAGTFHGHEGVRHLRQQTLDSFEDFRLEPEEVLEVAGWVVVPARAVVRGRTSGIETEFRETYAARVRDGLVVEVREYRTKEQALRALEAEP